MATWGSKQQHLNSESQRDEEVEEMLLGLGLPAQVRLSLGLEAAALGKRRRVC